MAVRPSSWLPSVAAWPAMRGSVSSQMIVGSPTSDAEALHEALVALDLGRDLLAVRDVEQADDRVRGRVAELRLGPLADEQSGLEVVRGERRVGDVRRVHLGVERDDRDARLAGVL